MKIIAVIPARSGSKSLKNKNIFNYKNRPLIFHSIKLAQQSKYIDSLSFEMILLFIILLV